MRLKEYFEKTDFKTKIIINIIFLILILGVIIFLIISPTVKNIKEIGEQIEEQKIDLEKKYKKGQILRNLAKNLKNIEPQIEKLDKAFIDKDSAIKFIGILESSSQKNDIDQKINLPSINDDTAEGEGQKIPLQLVAVGKFENLIHYLSDIESLSYYINIEKIEIVLEKDSRETTLDSQNNFSGNGKIFISANTYWK